MIDGGALRRREWRKFQFTRGSLRSSDFCGSGWLPRHFQCLATFFNPYRGMSPIAELRLGELTRDG